MVVKVSFELPDNAQLSGDDLEDFKAGLIGMVDGLVERKIRMFAKTYKASNRPEFDPSTLQFTVDS